MLFPESGAAVLRLVSVHERCNLSIHPGTLTLDAFLGCASNYLFSCLFMIGSILSLTPARGTNALKGVSFFMHKFRCNLGITCN